jgi:hypothetical protein
MSLNSLDMQNLTDQEKASASMAALCCHLFGDAEHAREALHFCTQQTYVYIEKFTESPKIFSAICMTIALLLSGTLKAQLKKGESLEECEDFLQTTLKFVEQMTREHLAILEVKLEAKQS